ncbi:ABC transporter, ATP-binding protein [Methylophaga frappieri]|uniref:ABC transporter, ATP-binding protein n=1 Tax=Methylophaga frappieri (strain ATCC BAA-2434 / DSM 25690 / JAM7) TaxID=754477 RepID=I1YI08_METFJ|nr:ABC transporter ATP-binding protein [Methylophaga frappieri]AFJ02551.1 ABC transporter, ATP-binding protein [Methylophaga frappieri]
MDSDYAIACHGLTKYFGETAAVNDLDLQIKAGQCFGLLGPNGAGKSTTIHMLTTMTSPSSGEALISGHALTENPVYIRSLVGLVFQDSALDRMMTVDENLQFAGALYGMLPAETNERIDTLLSIFNLDKKRHIKLAALSGGQRRAVDIARGVLHRPKVLFLDEPTIGLDVPSRRAIWRFIEQLRREQGMTVFLTTHYLEEAEACDSVDFMQQGKLQKGGKPARLMRDLASYILELNCAEPEQVSQQLASQFGMPLVEDQHLTFRVTEPETDFSALQRALGNKIISMQWRRPNLNDVYLWTVTQQGMSL